MKDAATLARVFRALSVDTRVRIVQLLKGARAMRQCARHAAGSDAGGQFLACGACLKLHNSEGSAVCPLSTLKDHYEVVRDSDRLVTI